MKKNGGEKVHPRTWTLVVAIGALLSAGVGMAMETPLFYSAKDTRARVVDELTGDPVEGAVVVARWALAVISGEEPSLHIAEAVTDKKGEFLIPGWGPKPRRPWTQLRDKSPQLLIFKHGYVPLSLHNESIEQITKSFPNYKTMSTKHLNGAAAWYEGTPNQRVQESMWNGLNIQLEPFKGTPDRWLDLLINLTYSIPNVDDKQVSQLFRAFIAERSYFREKRVSKKEETILRVFFSRVDPAGK